MILGWVMLLASLGATCDGMPRQVAANWRAKAAPRGMRRFLLWAFAAYLLRAAWTARQGDWLTALASLAGVLATGTLLAQQWLYASTPSEAPGGIL